MVYKSFKKGLIDSFQRKKLISLFWLINVVVSIIFLLPYLSEFNRFFSQRVIFSILEKANDYLYFVEFFHYSSISIPTIGMFLLLGKVVVMAISLALSGGIISIFLGQQPVTGKYLLSESWRFLVRIILLSFLQMIVAGFLFLLSIGFYLPFTLLLPSPFVENVYFYFFLGWVLLAFLFLLLAFLLFDLSRIQLVHHNYSSIFRAYWAAVVSFIRRPVSIYLVYLLLVVVWLFVMILYWKSQSFLADTSAAGLFLEFIFLQLFIWVQYWIRLSRYSALIHVLELSRVHA